MAAVSTGPGLYVLDLPVLRRRKSTFIHGIEDDAREVVAHLAVRGDSVAVLIAETD